MIGHTDRVGACRSTTRCPSAAPRRCATISSSSASRRPDPGGRPRRARAPRGDGRRGRRTPRGISVRVEISVREHRLRRTVPAQDQDRDVVRRLGARGEPLDVAPDRLADVLGPGAGRRGASSDSSRARPYSSPVALIASVTPSVITHSISPGSSGSATPRTGTRRPRTAADRRSVVEASERPPAGRKRYGRSWPALPYSTSPVGDVDDRRQERDEEAFGVVARDLAVGLAHHRRDVAGRAQRGALAERLAHGHEQAARQALARHVADEDEDPVGRRA